MNIPNKRMATYLKAIKAKFDLINYYGCEFNKLKQLDNCCWHITVHLRRQ